MVEPFLFLDNSLVKFHFENQSFLDLIQLSFSFLSLNEVEEQKTNIEANDKKFHHDINCPQPILNLFIRDVPGHEYLAAAYCKDH